MDRGFICIACRRHCWSHETVSTPWVFFGGESGCRNTKFWDLFGFYFSRRLSWSRFLHGWENQHRDAWAEGRPGTKSESNMKIERCSKMCKKCEVPCLIVRARPSRLKAWCVLGLVCAHRDSLFKRLITVFLSERRGESGLRRDKITKQTELGGHVLRLIIKPD